MSSSWKDVTYASGTVLALFGREHMVVGMTYFEGRPYHLVMQITDGVLSGSTREWGPSLTAEARVC